MADLETKARFIQQVITGHTAVRSAEDLEGGALTYAEIKAIASGNPAIMEKVRIDTEVRKLDHLRARGSQPAAQDPLAAPPPAQGDR